MKIRKCVRYKAMKLKKILLYVMMFALVFALFACGNEAAKDAPKADETTETTEANVNPESSENPGETEAQDEVVPEDSPYRSHLTGLPVASKEDEVRRPVAIMINNAKKALPQCGISKASIIYEALAEGGITRLLAVFENLEGIEQIGTIRSSRHYYIDFANSLDAIYVHIGGSPKAYEQLKSQKIASFDLIEGANSDMYWRDNTRIKNNGYEHSVFTSGEKLLAKFEKKGTRMTTQKGNAYNFSEDVVYEGNDATKISAVFSPYKTGTYTYDEESGLYRIGQYGTKHTDGLYGTQLAFKNVFVIHMKSWVIRGDEAGRLDFTSTGSGKGKYFVNGTATDITWKREGKSSAFKYYTEDGKELPVVPGDSYVAIDPIDAKVTVE